MMVWIDCGGSLIREHCGRIGCMYVWHRKQWHHRSCFSSSCCLPYCSPQIRHCKSLHIFSAISFISLINICQKLAACWLFVCESWKVWTLESSQLYLFFFSSPQQPMHEHYLQCVGMQFYWTNEGVKLKRSLRISTTCICYQSPQ
jgi:hypothetical protein